MNGLCHFAKQAANSVGRESGRLFRSRARRRRGLAAGAALHELRELAQFRLGNRPLELVELLVQQADILSVSDPERGEVRLRPSDLGGAFTEDGVELGQPASAERRCRRLEVARIGRGASLFR